LPAGCQTEKYRFRAVFEVSYQQLLSIRFYLIILHTSNQLLLNTTFLSRSHFFKHFKQIPDNARSFDNRLPCYFLPFSPIIFYFHLKVGPDLRS